MTDQIVEPGTYAFRFVVRAPGFSEILFENQIRLDRQMTMNEIAAGLRNTMAQQSNLPALHVDNWTSDLTMKRIR
ncbi:hypothetical protein HUT13_15455 [Streptomyces harbinensis]|uniref:hypothetical protein n=1 Tax=Streptomyces harbinensis TaxID=1176198 RepID=UPI0015916531|nr:hypothetical protein [Streptomyces harbinensis]QKV70015.1 hypothetical protein HUT13_15455 [Streptomyces harbinensis]